MNGRKRASLIVNASECVVLGGSGAGAGHIYNIFLYVFIFSLGRWDTLT